MAVLLYTPQGLFPLPGAAEGGEGRAGLLDPERPGVATDQGPLSTLVCWPPCPSAGTDWGVREQGSGACKGVPPAGESAPAVQDQVSPVTQHTARRVRGRPFPLGTFCFEA